MPARCLVRNLATLTQSASASKPRSSLLPSYSHSSTTSLTPRPTTALRPPYEHSLPSSAPSLSAPYKYTLLSNHEASNLDKLRNEHWNTWTGELIKTEEGRAQVIAIWTRSILELEKLKSTGARIPEVSFHSLASHLSSASTAEAISTIGSVIVRDVIPDAQAEQAARETLVEISQRGGQNVYWADALLGLRSDPSILSANNQLLRALSALPNGETVDPDSLILASGLQPGIENPGSRSTSLSHPWAIDEKALHPATPLVAHLALTKATGQAFQLPASIHASIYATLRPLFRHKRSKISFYSTSAYLDPVNWEVVSHDSIPTWSPSEVPSFPHLLGASVEVPTLRPGDVLYRNAGIPVPYDQQSVQEQDQVFLPVTPLPRNQGNVEYTNKQREAFEKGVPPPHALQGEESLVSLELGGGKNRIGSAGGRSAMGY